MPSFHGFRFNGCERIETELPHVLSLSNYKQAIYVPYAIKLFILIFTNSYEKNVLSDRVKIGNIVHNIYESVKKSKYSDCPIYVPMQPCLP